MRSAFEDMKLAAIQALIIAKRARYAGLNYFSKYCPEESALNWLESKLLSAEIDALEKEEKELIKKNLREQICQ